MGDGVSNSLHQSDWWSARQRGPTSRVKEWSCEYFEKIMLLSQWSRNLNIKETPFFLKKIYFYVDGAASGNIYSCLGFTFITAGGSSDALF